MPVFSQGTPAAVYLTIHNSIKQGNYNAMLPHFTATQQAKMKTDDPVKMMKMVQALMPQTVQVAGQR